MAAEFPRCVVCRTTVEPGQTVVFRPDGRVHHSECPTVQCLVCSREIRPGQPIRRDGGAMLHANCWVKRFRARTVNAAD